jgi:hypothetical protein
MPVNDSFARQAAVHARGRTMLSIRSIMRKFELGPTLAITLLTAVTGRIVGP